MTRIAKAKSHLTRSVLAACLCALALTQSQCGNITGCGGLGGTNINSQFNGCSGGSNIPPQSSINFLGNIGTVFSATISDTRASYSFKATVPLQVVYVNNIPPLRVVQPVTEHDPIAARNSGVIDLHHRGTGIDQAAGRYDIRERGG